MNNPTPVYTEAKMQAFNLTAGLINKLGEEAKPLSEATNAAELMKAVRALHNASVIPTEDYTALIKPLSIMRNVEILNK